MSAPSASHRQITVRRAGGWYGVFRKLAIVVDGNQVALLGRRESALVIVPPGAKLLWGAMDWATTKKVDLSNINDGDTISFKSYFTLNEIENLGVSTMPFKITRS